MKNWNELLKFSVVTVFSLTILFLANHGQAKAQSIDHQAYELFNLLEYAYFQIFSPTRQMTREGQDLLLRPYFYREYSDTGIQVRAYLDQNSLVVLDAQGEHNLGTTDYWISFTRSEILFQWLENRFPEFFYPYPSFPATQAVGEVFYRYYPGTNVIIASYQNILYYFDAQGAWHDLGRVDSWVEQIVDFPEVLGGVYTIQQEATGRYVDAHLDGDYNLVTRGAQNDDTQKWIITPLGNNVYTIQQKSNNRYVDAYTSEAFLSHEYNVVTRTAQNDDTQRWIITPLGNSLYTIQQKINYRYVDAYTDSHDYAVVTRPFQDDDTQKWIINWVPEDKRFLRIEYLIDEADVVFNEPTVLATEFLENNTDTPQVRMFTYSREVQQSSSFQHSAGIEVTVGMEFSAGVPGLQGTGWLSVTGWYDFTWGEQKTLTETYEGNYPVSVPPHRTYRATATLTIAELSVPYVMFFRSEGTGAIYESKGVWHGVTSWDSRTVFEDITDE